MSSSRSSLARLTPMKAREVCLRLVFPSEGTFMQFKGDAGRAVSTLVLSVSEYFLDNHSYF